MDRRSQYSVEQPGTSHSQTHKKHIYFRHMKLLHGDGFSDYELKRAKEIILDNLGNII